MLDAKTSKISFLICRRENPTFRNPCNSSPQSPLQLDQSFLMPCLSLAVQRGVVQVMGIFAVQSIFRNTQLTRLSILPSESWFKFKQWTEHEAALRIWGQGLFSGFFCFFFHYFLCSPGSRGRLADELSPRLYD